MEAHEIIWIEYIEYRLLKSILKHCNYYIHCFFHFLEDLKCIQNDKTIYNNYLHALQNYILCHV